MIYQVGFYQGKMEKEEESDRLQQSMVLKDQASSRGAFTFKEETEVPFPLFQKEEFLFFSASSFLK